MNIASSDVYTATLFDVHGTKVRLADWHGDGPVILSLSSRDAAADAEAFGKAITEMLGRSLLLDWKGTFHAVVGLDPKVAHFLVVDSAGEVRGPVSGIPTQEKLAAFRELL